MLRCLKNGSGVIVAMGNDEGQSGADANMSGTWCEWTINEQDLPAFAAVEGADLFALRFKENGTADGIELRLDADVLAAPQG
jgi:hypothetical protein